MYYRNASVCDRGVWMRFYALPIRPSECVLDLSVLCGLCQIRRWLVLRGRVVPGFVVEHTILSSKTLRR